MGKWHPIPTSPPVPKCDSGTVKDIMSFGRENRKTVQCFHAMKLFLDVSIYGTLSVETLSHPPICEQIVC